MNDATWNLPQPPFRLKALLFTLRVPSSSSIWHHQWHAYINRLACKSLLSARSFTFWDGAASLASYADERLFILHLFLFSFCASLCVLSKIKWKEIFFSTRFLFFISPKEKSENFFRKYFITQKKAIFFPQWCCESIFGWIISLSFRARSWDVIWAFYCLPYGKILAFGNSNSLPQCIVVVDSNHPDLYWLSRCHLGDVVTCRFWDAFKWLISSSAQNASLSDLLGWCAEEEFSVTRCSRSWFISLLDGEWRRIFRQKRDENEINCHYGELFAAFPITSI